MDAKYPNKIWQINKNGRELNTGREARGPVLSVGIDPQTGEIFYGQNYRGKPVPGLVDVLDARLGAWHEANPDYVPNPKTGVPGSHAEFDVLNQALATREARLGRPATNADIADIVIFNLATKKYEGSPIGSPKPRCDICKVLTDGAVVYPQ
jgi:hypothetical protein